MCMNKSIMSPESMSGALRNHKQTKFSGGGGAYSAPRTASCSYGSLRSPTGPHQKITHPPATGSAYGPVYRVVNSTYRLLNSIYRVITQYIELYIEFKNIITKMQMSLLGFRNPSIVFVSFNLCCVIQLSQDRYKSYFVFLHYNINRPNAASKTA